MGTIKITKAFLGCTHNLLLLPFSVQAIPAIKLKDDPWEHMTKYNELCDNHEPLRAYHAKLDLMDAMDNPDHENLKWQVENISDWELKKPNRDRKYLYKSLGWGDKG